MLGCRCSVVTLRVKKRSLNMSLSFPGIALNNGVTISPVAETCKYTCSIICDKNGLTERIHDFPEFAAMSHGVKIGVCQPFVPHDFP